MKRSITLVLALSFILILSGCLGSRVYIGGRNAYGKIVDETGAPAPGATISVSWEPLYGVPMYLFLFSGCKRQLQTDKNGNWRFRIPLTAAGVRASFRPNKRYEYRGDPNNDQSVSLITFSDLEEMRTSTTNPLVFGVRKRR